MTKEEAKLQKDIMFAENMISLYSGRMQTWQERKDYEMLKRDKYIEKLRGLRLEESKIKTP